jgi:hypothetical protein
MLDNSPTGAILRETLRLDRGLKKACRGGVGMAAVRVP